MKKFLISSSILSANFAKLGKEIEEVLFAGSDLIHFDIMDNHYVPNITFGPIVLKSIRKYGINAPIDVHLLAKPIDRLILDCVEAGSDFITFHIEATDRPIEVLKMIKKSGCKVGLAFNPETPIHNLENFIDEVDMILLMSVQPGFGNQSFLSSTIEKLKQVKFIIKNSKRNIRLAVDGGVKIHNITDIANAGADFFIIGSEIFSKMNYKSTIDSIKYCLKKISL